MNFLIYIAVAAATLNLWVVTGIIALVTRPEEKEKGIKR